MIGVLILLLLGVALSAFFSGSETGFYRATRIRLVVQGMRGDRVSSWLLWLTNNPSLFVATTLIGNNIANYITSLAIVLSTRLVVASETPVAEVVAPILFAPLLFVYGELLPKNLFFQAPNRLLRLGGPFFLFFTVLFSPLSGILWAMGRGLEKLVGQSPEKVQLTLARKELKQVLLEGQEAGILRPSQLELAHNLFSNASLPIQQFCKPVSRIPSLVRSTRRVDALRLARRNRAIALTVHEKSDRRPIGYLKTIDLYLHQDNSIPEPRPFLKFTRQESHSVALLKMQGEHETIAVVVDDQGETVGLVTVNDLIEPLLAGDLETLKR